MKLLFVILSCFFFPCTVFAISNEKPPEPHYKIDLQSAMNLAAQHSYNLKAAQANTNSAQDTYNSAFRALWPNLTGAANSTWQNNTLGQNAFHSTPQNLSSSGTLTFTQPLLGIIPLAHTVEQKNIALKISQTLRAASEIQAALLGAQYYLNLQLAFARVAIAQANITTLQKSKQDAQSLFETGSIYKDDYLRILLQYTQAQQSLVNEKSGLNIALFSLAQSLGINSANDMKVIASDLSHWEKNNFNLPDLEESKQIAFKQNQNILVAQSNVQLAEMNKTLSEDNYLPSLNAVVSYTKNFNSYDIHTNLSPENTVAYGFSLTWNIWDWGVRSAQNSALVEQVSSQEYLSESEKETILNSVVSQYYSIVNNISAVKTAKESVTTADEAFNLVSFRFLNGQVTALDLITAQQNLTASKADLAQARFNLDLAWLTFQTVLGKNPAL
ncbi:MAG: TolC family protein [Bdellovibrionota bacterium]